MANLMVRSLGCVASGSFQGGSEVFCGDGLDTGMGWERALNKLGAIEIPESGAIDHKPRLNGLDHEMALFIADSRYCPSISSKQMVPRSF